MADAPKSVTSVQLGIAVRDGAVLLSIRAQGAPDIPITVDPQAAFEMGEKMARAAHEARFGEPIQMDGSYLHQQIRERCTEDMRKFLAQRVSVMLNSLREDKKWSNKKLAQEFVDIVLTKVA